MANDIESRLAGLGITLPTPPPPVAAYVPFVQVGNMVHVSGQLPIAPNLLMKGKLGDGNDVESGAAAAELCAVNLLAQVRAACEGDLDRLERVVKLTGFVNCTPDFTDHPKVINGASELLSKVIGDAGRHARSAVGVSSLPFGALVEVEGIFAVN